MEDAYIDDETGDGTDADHDDTDDNNDDEAI